MDKYIITGAHGDIALSMAQILREDNPNNSLIGTDITSQWPARALFDAVEIISRADSEAYLNDLNKLNEQHKPTAIIPTSEPELRWIAQNYNAFAHLPLVINESPLILSCMDKFQSMKWLESIHVTAPQTCLLKDADESKLPLLVKPRYGAGSRGIECVETAARLQAIKSERDIDNVAQEYLANDDEYTCALITLKSGPRHFIMKRKLKDGVTVEMMGVENQAISNILLQIAKHLPLHAALNVQLRLTENGPMIFEINPRFSSTVKMRHMLGFSDFLWLLQDKVGKFLSDSHPQLNQKVYRIYQEIREQ